MSETKCIRVVIADDHPIVRAGLVGLIEREPDLQIVAEARDGEEAISAYQRCRPDLLIMDLRMPGIDGLTALTQIRRLEPAAKVLLLTTFEDEEDIYRGLEWGASGYLLKDAARLELLAAIRKVHQGGKAIAARVAERLADRIRQPELSARELDVLRLVAQGLGNKQIAQQLDIAVGTVKVHVANLLQKLEAQGRSEAIAIAVRRGLVRLD